MSRGRDPLVRAGEANTSRARCDSDTIATPSEAPPPGLGCAAIARSALSAIGWNGKIASGGNPAVSMPA